MMPPFRTRHESRRDEEGPLLMAAQQRDDRGRLPADRDDRPLPRLHQTRALHQLRLRSQGDLLQRRQHLQKLAGPDRRRRSRQSDRRRTRRRRHRGPLHGRAAPGRPIHEDAFAEIRPRIFLEGNFFIELDPGSPSAPEMDSGDTIPVSHTSTAVQLDEILTALQSPVRADLGQPARRLRDRAERDADRRRRRDPASRGPGQDRRRSAQRRSSNTAATPAATAPRSPTPSSAPARTTSRG